MSLIKVAIVEDEELIRKGLIHTIDWLSIGCTVVAEADNGLKGLKLIEKDVPDLVITDIKMPIMNGIEMLTQAQERNLYSFESIILTSYSDFEFAKQAISLKVFDYILKPVDESKLYDAVRRAIKEIEKKKRLKNIYKNFKEKEEFSVIDKQIFISSNYTNTYVQKALQKIKEQYNKKLSIETIAEELGISASYLSRKFKDETTMTFLDILNKQRVEKAIELMKIGTYRIYEVSEKVGFSDYKHFCNVFKKYTNIAPTDFMKSKSIIINK